MGRASFSRAPMADGLWRVGLVSVPAANLCFKALEISLESACLSWGGRSFDYVY